MTCTPNWIDTKSLLARVPMFAGMEPSGLARLASATREINAPRGLVVVRKGDVCNGVYLIVYGRVKLVISSERGAEKVLDILDQGRLFCVATVFLEKNYTVQAQTLSDCLLFHIGKNAILSELENDSQLARRMMTSLSEGIYERLVDIESCSLRSGRQRVSAYLLNEIESEKERQRVVFGEQAAPPGVDASPKIVLEDSKGNIASKLSLSSEHFSRILHEMADCGLLFISGRHLYIRDVEQLRRVAS